jgi:thioredoxin 1
MKISSEEVRKKINDGDTFIVDFYADWCGPCRMLSPIIENVSKKLEEEGHKVKVYKFNIEEDRDLAVELGVRSIPNIKGFVGGKMTSNKVGMLSEDQLIEMANQLIL